MVSRRRTTRSTKRSQRRTKLTGRRTKRTRRRTTRSTKRTRRRTRSERRTKRTRRTLKTGGTLSVGPSSTKWTMYSGPNAEKIFPKHVKAEKDKKLKEQEERLKEEELKEQNEKQMKVVSDLKQSEKQWKKMGLPLEKKEKETPTKLRTNEENRVSAEIASPWGF